MQKRFLNLPENIAEEKVLDSENGLKNASPDQNSCRIACPICNALKNGIIKMTKKHKETELRRESWLVRKEARRE